MTFTQFKWKWSGWPGGDGVTLLRCFDNLDSTQTDAAAAAQRVFWNAIKGYLPAAIKLSCEPVVQVYADGDGGLADQRSIATMPADVQGAGAGNWSAVAGCCVIWRTAQPMGRRMLMGRTFLIPGANSMYGTDGRVEAGFRAVVNAALTTYVTRVGTGTPGRPVVWHRNTKGATNGLSAPVTSAAVGLKVAELVRRRD